MKASPFQVIVLAIFGIAIIAGVIVLATTKSGNSNAKISVTIWGTIPSDTFANAVGDITQGKDGFKINYVSKKADVFDQELIEALASGVGPDAIILPHELIVRHRDKTTPLPFSSMSLPVFKSTFVQIGELYLGANGITALPFMLDPLVTYWNRDMLANTGTALPPKTWDEFIALVPKLTVKDQNANIIKSGMALGEFRNVTNAKEIVSAFLLQTGNPITLYNPNDVSGLAVKLSPPTLGTIGALNFYTDFANPVKPDYSWNRSLPNSSDMFVAGDLAFYFGFASEVKKIRDKNPNLNFDVTSFPQPKGAKVAVTYGRMHGIAVLKSSKNVSNTFSVVGAIVGSGPIKRLSDSTGLPPVRRSMLVANPDDPYQSVFYNSAIQARAFLDPNPAITRSIFQNMIESVTSGEREVSEAINAAGGELVNLVRSL